ncbi:MAG: hypothetical protein RLZZ227_1253 [Pseudomonadota bacterium]|jgi:hypothetical protein
MPLGLLSHRIAVKKGNRQLVFCNDSTLRELAEDTVFIPILVTVFDSPKVGIVPIALNGDLPLVTYSPKFIPDR